jgi:hypothetical protein
MYVLGVLLKRMIISVGMSPKRGLMFDYVAFQYLSFSSVVHVCVRGIQNAPKTPDPRFCMYKVISRKSIGLPRPNRLVPWIIPSSERLQPREIAWRKFLICLCAPSGPRLLLLLLVLLLLCCCL